MHESSVRSYLWFEKEVVYEVLTFVLSCLPYVQKFAQTRISVFNNFRFHIFFSFAWQKPSNTAQLCLGCHQSVGMAWTCNSVLASLLSSVYSFSSSTASHL